MQRLSPWRSDGGESPPRSVPLPPRGAGPAAPPQRFGMPAWRGTRPLKRWRYVGIFSERLSICAAQAAVGPARQSFWALWDGERLRERTHLLRHDAVSLGPGSLHVAEANVRIEVALSEDEGVETVCPNGAHYVWTRKQAAIGARGEAVIGGRRIAIDALAVIDDTAGYHSRHTDWCWSAGVGHDCDGRTIGWNLVSGVNDPVSASERTVWIAGEPREVGPVSFAPALERIAFAEEGAVLEFSAAATRRRRERLLLLSSEYEQPFGAFAGRLPGVELARGHGVMERHSARW